MTAIVQDQVDEKRRRVLLIATSAAGGVLAAGAVAPLVASWFPSARALAAGAPVQADISKIEAGQQITIEWRGKPVWLLRRTPEMVQVLEKNANAGFLTDPQSKDSKQPEYCKNTERSIKKDMFVCVGVCTHLGCTPNLKKEIGAASDMGADWPGGYLCPCHGSRFDLAGRVMNGSPAPINLEIPPNRYEGDAIVVVGEDQSKGG
jgi:ubiquinol-cytochrome c reductase iron-sulfur subunit